jgi:hypothetical protein
MTDPVLDACMLKTPRTLCDTDLCEHFHGTTGDGFATGHCTAAKEDAAVGTTAAGFRSVFDFDTAKRPGPRSASYCWHPEMRGAEMRLF